MLLLDFTLLLLGMLVLPLRESQGGYEVEDCKGTVL